MSAETDYLRYAKRTSKISTPEHAFMCYPKGVFNLGRTHDYWNSRQMRLQHLSV
jgi:hypothetical protein